jgi:nifR3 family TIM-barrel protein
MYLSWMLISLNVTELLKQNSIWLAPMAGVNDAPFRGICKGLGAGLTCSEMVSAKGLHYGSTRNRSYAYLRLSPGETPAAVQLFGADPAIMAEQAAAIVELLGDDLALLDVNMGCPVPKVFNKGEGSALMRKPELAADIVRAMVAALAGTDIPVTAKIRSGVDDAHKNAVECALRLEDAGAAAVGVHGRTTEQHYRGVSDPAVIAAVKERVSIPVLASGDIMHAGDALRIMQDTGADGCLVARGARGNPWIFRDIAALRRGEAVPDPPSYEERFAVIREHAHGIVDYFGERSLMRMRKHALWYVAGLPGAAFFRARLFKVHTLSELDALLDEYEAYLDK